MGELPDDFKQLGRVAAFRDLRAVAHSGARFTVDHLHSAFDLSPSCESRHGGVLEGVA